MRILLFISSCCGVLAMVLLQCQADEGPDKRYIAALAKNGRLPKFAHKKNEDSKEVLPAEAVVYPLTDSIEYDESEEDRDWEKRSSLHDDEDDCHDVEQKRYVAALARSGRLPIWHSQRMWATGKRDEDQKRKRCNQRKRSATPQPYEDGYLYSYEDGEQDSKLVSFNPDEKRNLAALARNGKLPAFNQDGKRNVAAMARNGKLPSFIQEGKRNVAALARNGKLPAFNQDGKRNVAALARNGKLPSFNQEGKRNIQAMARNGQLPFIKRNIQAMARNGKLLFNSYPVKKSSSEEENILVDVFPDKRNLAALARNGKLPFNRFDNLSEKRNIAALARNGKLPTYNDDGKRMGKLQSSM